MNIENPFDNLQKSHEDSLEYKKKRDEFFIAIHKHEMPMNEKQISLLKMAANDIKCVLEKYGVSVDTETALSHIHIVSPSFFKDVCWDENADAGYSSHFGEIILKWKITETQSVFANKAVHEILHYFQFDNRKQAKEETSLDEESLGMMIRGENKILFTNMLEAVTQKLTREVMKLNQDPEVAQENECLRNNFKKNPDEGYTLGLGKPKGSGYIIPYKPIQIYKKHIQKFDEMLQKIQESNKDQFGNIEEIFKIFVDAAFSGKRLPVFRLIEKTYGTRSKTLKKIRKIFGKKSALRDVAKKWS